MQYCLDKLAVDKNDAIVDFDDNNLTDSFDFKNCRSNWK